MLKSHKMLNILKSSNVLIFRRENQTEIITLITRAMSLFFSAISIHSRNSFSKREIVRAHLNTSRFQFLHISRNNYFLNFIFILFSLLLYGWRSPVSISLKQNEQPLGGFYRLQQWLHQVYLIACDLL